MLELEERKTTRLPWERQREGELRGGTAFCSSKVDSEQETDMIEKVESCNVFWTIYRIN